MDKLERTIPVTPQIVATWLQNASDSLVLVPDGPSGPSVAGVPTREQIRMGELLEAAIDYAQDFGALLADGHVTLEQFDHILEIMRHLRVMLEKSKPIETP